MSNNKHILSKNNFQTGLTRLYRQRTRRILTKKSLLRNRYFNRLTSSLLIFFFLSNTGGVFGQEKNVSNGNQQWLQYYNQTKLGNNWTWLSDGGYRWKDGFQKSSQYLVRTAIGYMINPHIRISSGFAHLGFFSKGNLNKMEFRPYQELHLKNKISKIELSHRYRIEERFFNPVIDGEIQTPNEFNFRFRYSIMVSIPLFKLSKEKTDKVFLLNIGDEIFINAGNDIVYNVFDQNRFIISPTFKLNEQVTFSLTWNSQFAGTTTQGSFVNTNVIWIQVKHKLNLTSKKQNVTG